MQPATIHTPTRRTLAATLELRILEAIERGGKGSALTNSLSDHARLVSGAEIQDVADAIERLVNERVIEAEKYSADTGTFVPWADFGSPRQFFHGPPFGDPRLRLTARGRKWFEEHKHELPTNEEIQQDILQYLGTAEIARPGARVDVSEIARSLLLNDWTAKRVAEQLVADGLIAGQLEGTCFILQLTGNGRAWLKPDMQKRNILPVEQYGWHERITAMSGALFRDGHYKNAVLEAHICVINRVKELSGLALDGDSLMNRAFGCDNKSVPALALNPLATEAERDEQRGFMYLCKGLVALRNVGAHTNLPIDDPMAAHEHLALASLVLRTLDRISPAVSTAP